MSVANSQSQCQAHSAVLDVHCRVELPLLCCVTQRTSVASETVTSLSIARHIFQTQWAFHVLHTSPLNQCSAFGLLHRRC